MDCMRGSGLQGAGGNWQVMQVLRQFMLLPEAEIQELDGLARRVHLAAVEKQEEEELLQVNSPQST